MRSVGGIGIRSAGAAVHRMRLGPAGLPAYADGISHRGSEVTMRRTPSSWAAPFALGGLLLAGGHAQAAEQDPLVACPQLAAHLQDQLGPVVADNSSDGRVQVRFRWQDRRAAVVEVVGQPWYYHRFVRRALRVAPCPALPEQGVYVLNIEFRDL
jgi:hypothetical protein